MSPIHFVRKCYCSAKMDRVFAGPHIQAIQILCQLCSASNVDIILRIIGPIKFCNQLIKISKCPLKFGNLHVFEWAMGHWLILRAHHHFEPGLFLQQPSKNRIFKYTLLSGGLCTLALKT